MNDYHMLPDRTESERFLISAIMDDGRRFLDAYGQVNAADFSQECFSAAWEWLSALSEKNLPLTLYTLKQHYGTHHQFQTFKSLIYGLGDGMIPILFPEYLRDVRNHSRRARALKDISRLHSLAEASTSAEEVLEGIQRLFEDNCTETASNGFRKAREIVADIEDMLANPSKAPRYRTGFPTLDLMIKGGMTGGQLVIIAGRTGGGKTVLAMNLAVQMAMDAAPVAVFSLEMADTDLLVRCILSETADNISDDEAKERIRHLPLYVDSTSNVNVRTISAKIRIMASRKSVRVVVVDYLQLIGTEGNTRESRERLVADMSRRLKIAAKENNVVVVALSQVNADGELRESRAIEQDADLVLQVLDDDEGEEWFLRVCKQRGGASHGPRSRMKEDNPGIPVNFHKPIFRFLER